MQPSLFDLSARPAPAARSGSALSPTSEALLLRYRELRLASGGHASTVAREVSQLRSLVRGVGTAAALPTVFRDAATLARLLLEPGAVIAASTGRCRLVATQRFVRLCGDQVGITDADRFLTDLDALLPARTQHDWHSAGIIVAGARSRRRPLGPTLEPADLGRIVMAVTAATAWREPRDRALVALHCFSGLRPEDTGPVRWSQVVDDPESGEVSIQLWRRGRWLRLPLAPPAADALLALRPAVPDREGASREQFVFRRGEHAGQPLTPRAVREIVRRACKRAGFPPVSATDLRAAFGYWLRAQGLSDHETAAVLGLQQVRSVDRLLARHRALDAQRRVREVLLNG